MSAPRTSNQFFSTASLVSVLTYNSGLQIESQDYIKLLSRTSLDRLVDRFIYLTNLSLGRFEPWKAFLMRPLRLELQRSLAAC